MSIFTGALFLVMVTGWLGPSRFGLWEVILSFVAFAAYPASWLGFWATREVARGRLVGRTVIFLNLGLGVAATVVYLAYSILSYAHFSTSSFPFLLAAVLVPLAFWNQAANSVAAGYRPSALGYSVLLSELAKLAVAYPALFIFKLDIEGVILALIGSYLVQAAVTTALVTRAVSDPINLASGRRWLVDSWVPAYYALGATVAVADTVAASLVSGGTTVTGYYQAAFQVGTLVSYVTFLSYALYPLLLRGESDEAPNATLNLILMFGVPMAAGVIALSPYLLAVLSPAYPGVYLSLGVLAVVGLVSAVSAFVDSTIIGRERADAGQQRSARDYLRSSFSFVSLANLAYGVFYLLSTVLVTGFGTAAGLPVPTVVALWALLQLLIMTSVLVVKFRRMMRVTKLRFPHSLPAYLLSAAVMVVGLLVLSSLLPPQVDRLTYGLEVGAVAGGGALVYFVVLLAVDSRARRLASALFG